jgi:hypothetical protein
MFTKHLNPAALIGQAPTISRHRYVALLLAAWTVMVFFFLPGNLHQEDQKNLEMARVEARSRICQIILDRQWQARFQGSYVPAEVQTPANPYLNSTAGRNLTLVNPAYLTQHVFELGLPPNKVEGRLLHLKPLEPGNAPDLWEVKVLKKLKNEAPEYGSMEYSQDHNYLCLVRPLITAQACLARHPVQVYQEGVFAKG